MTQPPHTRHRSSRCSMAASPAGPALASMARALPVCRRQACVAVADDCAARTRAAVDRNEAINSHVMPASHGRAGPLANTQYGECLRHPAAPVRVAV
jgi:hypothetical protein